MFNSAIEMSYREAQLYRFKAEHAEKRFARLQAETSEGDRNLAKEHAQAIRRAERKAKREIFAVVGSRASQFMDKYEKLKQAQDLVGDFREY